MIRRLAAPLAMALGLLPTPATTQPADPDSMSVEDLVRAVQVGQYGLRSWPVVQRAAQACRTAPPGSREQEVLRGLLAEPLASLFGPDGENWRNNAAGSIGEAMSYALPCRSLAVEGWLRAALYADLDVDAYMPLVEGLARGLGGTLVGRVVYDEEADPDHRVWAAEALVLHPPFDARRIPLPASIPLENLVALHARGGLPDAYVRKWLPLLLASPHTREGIVHELAPVLRGRPDIPGTASILRVIGPNVEAYAYRFSDESRTIVRELLDDLSRRADDLSPEVLDAVRDVLIARAAARNHLGNPVRRQDLVLDVREVAGTCVLGGPAAVLEAVERVAPGYRVPDGGTCSSAAIQYGDFNGDGGRDVLIRVATSDGPAAVAIVSGAPPTAHRLDPEPPDSIVSIAPPGVFKANWCLSPEVFTFPNDYIDMSGNYFSSAYRFDGRDFVLVASSGTCA